MSRTREITCRPRSPCPPSRLPPSSHTNSLCRRGKTYSTRVQRSRTVEVLWWLPRSSSSPAADQTWRPGKPSAKPCQARPRNQNDTLHGNVTLQVKVSRENASPSPTQSSILSTFPRHPVPSQSLPPRPVPPTHSGSSTTREFEGTADSCLPRQRERPFSKSSWKSTSPSATDA